jgi:hypothetical protein
MSYLIHTMRDTLENWQSEFLQSEVGRAPASRWPQSNEGGDRVEEKIDAILRQVVRRVGTLPSRSLTAALNANRTMRQSIGARDLNPAMAELRAVSNSVAERLVAGFCRKSNWTRTLDPLLSRARRCDRRACEPPLPVSM